MLQLAEDYTIVYSVSSENKYAVSTPSVLRLAHGRILVSFDCYIADRSAEYLATTKIFSSEDDGQTWNFVAELKTWHGRLFLSGNHVYYIGCDPNLIISHSIDGGLSWSEPSALTLGEVWHQSACNVWYTNNSIYLVMEKITGGMHDTWPVPWIAPVLIRARIGADLSLRSSWEFASDLIFSDLIPGFKQNQGQLEFFGVPFFSQSYPYRNHLGNKRYMHPMGWLEGNVAQIQDPTHTWFDPLHKTFHLLMRCNTGSVGYAALLKVVEHQNGRMSTMLETVPSGKKLLFLPLPGGHLRFHICYDNFTKLYWLLSNQPTDSLRKIDTLDASRSNLPSNERNRLVLHFSRNLVDWCFAGLVRASTNGYENHCYSAMEIDNSDLIIVSRAGLPNSGDARDTRLITFKRVRNFRELVY